MEEGEWARAEIRCGNCAEVRLIYASIDSPALATGCYRFSPTGDLKRGDLVVCGHRLDTFEQALPGGWAITRNAGGGTYRERLEDLRPY